jgi:hypothetical protein
MEIINKSMYDSRTKIRNRVCAEPEFGSYEVCSHRVGAEKNNPTVPLRVVRGD